METKVLAVAAGHEITEDEVNQFINNMPQEQRAYMSNPQARAQLLEQIIHLHLFAAYGKKELNIPATDAYKKVLENAKRIVVLEDVENPTNIGAIFRSAAAFGIDAVLLSPACVDPFYRRAMRVSVGNVLLVPWAYIGSSEARWKEEGIGWLKEEGFQTVAMALRSDNIRIDDPVLKQKDRLAIIMGNEGLGLAESTINAADYVAKIPMMNGVDSLNVAVAAGLAMWELTQHRNQ